MIRKVLIFLVLCWPMLAQDKIPDPCIAMGPQDWEVVFSQVATPEMASQNIVPVVDYESMLVTAAKQSYMSEEGRSRLLYALKTVAENYPQHNLQPFQVFKVGLHRNPDCGQVALQAVPFEQPAPVSNEMQQQVAAKVAEVIPQVIGVEFRRQQEAQAGQQVTVPSQQVYDSRPSVISRGAQIGQGALGFFVHPAIGAIGVARPAIEMIAGWIAPGDDPTVRTLSAKGISPGPNNSVKLKNDWYKNPDW